MVPKVLVTRKFFPDVFSTSGYQVEYWEGRGPVTRDRLLRGDFDALVSMLFDRIDCEVLSSPRLRLVAQYAVGYDNIDLQCATSRGIYVTNTPDVLTEATAEFTWALIMAAARRVVEGDAMVRSGKWAEHDVPWDPTLLLGMELKGKQLGVVGFGRIGLRVGEIGRAFGMNVAYWSRGRRFVPWATRMELESLFSTSDVISVNLPLTPETKHLVGERLLSLVKPTAILVNTARGPVVDTEALVRALSSGRVAAVGLDVFEEEPLPPDSPLCRFNNVVLAPHLGSATTEARRAMALTVVRNLRAFLEGDVPPTLVNREVVSFRRPGFGN
ncbi:D-glycerate dehydrogenase [Sulfodiicoccus acidiphilus]|uniref:D-glycerate dehydrogenase n=1 Tax=Sulfodiicoccus acidiphilus TaxID=1670455 RepID=A0A348B4R1_9CREN|nr:D-glycerate dehydrogenase [Sulfodiicoccus acidiphilus]BBD73163.1 D-glycerate dehydrogenase [Sulfodiicoccus acidiphilus]GGU01245.1 D-glycerate dehydrogenase [Sulfodiicoccus acidiphilus]